MKQADEKKQDKKQGNKQAVTPTEPVEGLHIGERPRRNHKDSTFCLLFSEPERAIELYNAVTYAGREFAAGYRVDLHDPRKCPLYRPQQ